MPRTALIAGAGIGGLAAGLALRRQGWSVRILERAASPRELGFALMLAPNALAALDELGIGETVRARGHAPSSADIFGAGGRRLRRLQLDRIRRTALPLMALRTVLHGTLLDAVGLDTISTGSAVAGFAEIDGAVSVSLDGGLTERGDLLLGADGIGSVVRAGLHPGEPPAFESGYCGLRGVAHGAEAALGGVDAIFCLQPGIEAAAVKAGEGAVYWYVSRLSSDVNAVTDALVARDQWAATIGEPFRSVALASRAEDVRFDRFVRRRPLTGWGRGRVTLLGDAAHPVLPHTGQGAAQALEDAVALGLAMAGTDDVESRLRLYERVRERRTRKVVAAGPRIAAVTTTHNRLIGTGRDTFLRVLPLAGIRLAARLPVRDPHASLR